MDFRTTRWLFSCSAYYYFFFPSNFGAVWDEGFGICRKFLDPKKVKVKDNSSVLGEDFVCVYGKKVVSGSPFLHPDTPRGLERIPLESREMKTSRFPHLLVSGERPSDRNVHVPPGEKEKVQRRSRPEGWGWGWHPPPSVGDRGPSASREALSEAGRGPRAAQRAPGPRHPQAALPRVPCRSCPGGRRSPGAVAGRGVQGALWPSGAGGRSGHGDAGGFAEDPRLQHLRRPAAALRPRPVSAALLREPRGCGGP